MKVVTTAAALEILGPDFTFHTRLGYTGKIIPQTGILEGNLILKGGCDPGFYSEYFPDHYNGTFEQWAADLLKAGIQTVHGDLIVDLNQMDGPLVPGGWQWEDTGNYYGAGVSALSYSDNFYKNHFSSPGEPNQPSTIENIEPPIENLNLQNRVISSSVNRDLTNVYGAPGSGFQSVEGSVPAGRTDFIIKAAMPDPSLVAATDFIRVLKKFNIAVQGKIVFAKKSDDELFTLVSDKSSPPLRDLLVPLNLESINLFAEHLWREIGRTRKNATSPAKCSEAIKEFWTDKQVFTEGFYPADGSGLSRSNGICPRTLAEILHYMYHSPNRDDFFNSLPVAGQSGTLKSAFKGSKLENNLCGKTGSMTRVKSLTGIFTRPNGQKSDFCHNNQ